MNSSLKNVSINHGILISREKAKFKSSVLLSSRSDCWLSVVT